MAIIKNDYNLDPYDPDSIYLFCGRRTDRIKAIIYEGDGRVLLYKKLVDGNFQWPRGPEEIENISLQQYRWLMDRFKVNQEIHNSSVSYQGLVKKQVKLVLFLQESVARNLVKSIGCG